MDRSFTLSLLDRTGGVDETCRERYRRFGCDDGELHRHIDMQPNDGTAEESQITGVDCVSIKIKGDDGTAAWR